MTPEKMQELADLPTFDAFKDDVFATHGVGEGNSRGVPWTTIVPLTQDFIRKATGLRLSPAEAKDLFNTASRAQFEAWRESRKT